MIKYVLWDKKLGRYLTSDECYNIGLSHDGRLIAFDTCMFDLDTEDITDQYIIEFTVDGDLEC